MKSEKRNSVDLVLFGIVALCSVLCMVAVSTWAYPCTGVLELANGNAAPMRCFFTTKVIKLLSAILLIVAVKGLITGQFDRTACFLLAVGIIAVTFESVIGIGVCKAEMACWTTAFWARLCAGVSIVAICASGVLGLMEKQAK